jgi:hypothetical protein
MNERANISMPFRHPLHWLHEKRFFEMPPQFKLQMIPLSQRHPAHKDIGARGER